MKIIYNDWLKKELPEYLLSQKGISEVEIVEKNKMDLITINGTVSPSIIAKYIDLFQESKFSTMFAFDKGKKDNIKKLEYHVEDMCCEYCHQDFVRKLFENEDIICVESNFSLDKPAYNIKYDIYYKENIYETEIIKYIEKSL